MNQLREIDIEGAAALLASGSADFLDIRDPQSHAHGHVPGALLVDPESLQAFLAEADRTRTLVVYCFHGNSSRPAAAWLAEQGFQDVRSLSGGFEAWRTTGNVARTA